jgi:hypothetical protein
LLFASQETAAIKPTSDAGRRLARHTIEVREAGTLRHAKIQRGIRPDATVWGAATQIGARLVNRAPAWCANPQREILTPCFYCRFRYWHGCCNEEPDILICRGTVGLQQD